MNGERQYTESEVAEYLKRSDGMGAAVYNMGFDDGKKYGDYNMLLIHTLKELQEECGYASPWWIKIEKVLNPKNPVLKEGP